MPAQNTDQAMHLAVSHHQAGRFADAEQIYRQILATLPNHPDALHLLGVLHGQTNRHAVAADYIRRAISANPRNPAYYSNLGFSLLQLAQFDAAANTYQQLIALQPRNADAHYHLGNILFTKGALEPAIASYQRAIAVNPQYFEALHNLGNALVAVKQYDQAIAIGGRAIALNPMYPATHNNLGNAWKAKGNLSDAIACYQHALLLDPNYAEAHNNLGNTRRENEEVALAIASYQKAIALNPNNAEFHSNLGSAYLANDEPDLAVESLQHAVILDPNYPIAIFNLGLAWNAKEEPEKATECFEKAAALKPDYADAWLQLGLLHIDSEQLDKSMECLTRALAITPGSADIHNAIGINFHRQGNFEQSIICHLRALELRPVFLQALHNLGNSFLEKGMFPAAINSYEQALAIDPKHIKILGGLAHSWKRSAQLDQAIKYYDQALAIDPDAVENLIGIAGTYQDMGEIDTSLGYFRRALEIEPDNMSTRDGLLFTLGFQASANAQDFFNEWSEWNKRFVIPVAYQIQPHTNDRTPDRRLRVGYVSPDFKNHPVSRFVLPLLASHDHQSFEIFCYSNVTKPDETTAKLQPMADHWIPIYGKPDDEVADIIRTDQIDILIDLAMHTANHRLMVFARKPAPVQITYLALAAGTGVAAIDYRFTDQYLDPNPEDDRFYLEKSVRLEGTYWCYQPIPQAPAVSVLPALTRGFITFGCLNKFSKVSRAALELWTTLLHKLPNSRLMLHLNSGGHRAQLLNFMSERGISADRIEILPFVSVEEYLATYHRIDIALDPFPCSGGTTTCDALWMGVPVVTLSGATSLARASASILANAGLPELVARSNEQYTQIVLDLANDLPKLSTLRSTIRPQMQGSALMDPIAYTRSIESAYQTLWRHWCQLII